MMYNDWGERANKWHHKIVFDVWKRYSQENMINGGSILMGVVSVSYLTMCAYAVNRIQAKNRINSMGIHDYFSKF